MAGWTEFPIVTGVTSFQAWLWSRQFTAALRERWVAVEGTDFFPPVNFIWDSGLVAGITSTTVTISSDPPKAWCHGFSNPWGCTDIDDAPGSFDLIIDSCDPKKCIRTLIESWTTNTLTVANLDHFVTERVVTSLSQFSGKPAYIVKSSLEESSVRWWSERILEWPNDQVFAEGDIDSSTTTTITYDAATWTTNQWAGKNVMYRDATPTIRRGIISANTTNTLTFSGGSGTPTGKFYVVGNDAYFQWERIPGEPCTYLTPGPPFAWYRGATDSWYSHYPYDTGDGFITYTQKPAYLVSYFDGANPPCEPTTTQILDRDLRTNFGDCVSDRLFNPDVYKAIRQWQTWIEENVHHFVPVADYDGYEGLEIPTYTRATAGIGAGNTSGTTGAHIGTTGISVSLSVPSQPINVRYTIKDDDGLTIVQGDSTYDSGVLAGDFSLQVDGVYIYEGRAISVTYEQGGSGGYGWTRWLPREFKRMHEKTVWIPEIDEFAFPPAAVDPPTEDHPGKWMTKPVSTSYITHGGTTPPGSVIESGYAEDFVANGDLARYIGDNWSDPAIWGNISFFKDGPTGEPPLMRYWDKSYVGKHPDNVQGALDAQLSCAATSGTSRSFTDSSKDWYTNNWYGGGILYTETGTATGGSTTSLTDASKTLSGLWDEDNSWWIDAIIEVQISGVWYKRPITSHTGTTVGWSEALSSSASGKSYRFRMPRTEKNRYKGRTFTITKLDDTTVDVVITQNDDNTIFFADVGFAIEEGMTGYITEPATGTVWKRSGGTWVKPTGIDSRSGRAFPDDQTRIAPTAVRRYGRFMMGDYITSTLFQELYAAINKLVWTKAPMGWTSRHDLVTSELNVKFAFQESTSTDNWVRDFKNVTENYWNTMPNTAESNGAAPAHYSAGGTSLLHDVGSAYLYALYAYGVVSNIPNGGYCPIAHITEYYDYAAIDSANHDEGVYECEPNPGEPSDCNLLFDANGDIVAYRKWKRFSAVGPTTEHQNVSGKLGSISKPPWVDDIPNNTEEALSVRGYQVINQTAIIKWNVAGGFQYVADNSEFWWWW